tara:strand:+ start:145 stop:585 length:441 start_codon:yes stop_codon:yes gene_type:complete
MKLNKATLIALSLFMTNSALAKVESPISTKQMATVVGYGKALETHDAAMMERLFKDNGVVVSTSKGKVNAKSFFRDFLPYVVSAKLTFENFYQTTESKNSYSASFDLDMTLESGEKIHSHFIDEFHFKNNETKLSKVVMYESPKYR